MRKFLVGLVALAFVGVACASNDNTGASSGSIETTSGRRRRSPRPPAVRRARRFTTSGTFTVGTDNPAYPPYFQGGTEKGSDWKFNDPNNGKGSRARSRTRSPRSSASPPIR